MSDRIHASSPRDPMEAILNPRLDGMSGRETGVDELACRALESCEPGLPAAERQARTAFCIRALARLVAERAPAAMLAVVEDRVARREFGLALESLVAAVNHRG